jgi:hypothetical protein
MTTAFDAMLALARQVGLTEGTATGGSSTTLVDSGLGGTDDEYNGGTAFLITDAGGAGAAPENESASITDYAASTGTVTVTFSAAPGAGDAYGLCKTPRYRLYQAINLALSDLRKVPFEDDTSLDTAASTLAYTIPAAAKRDLRQVWLALNKTAPIHWQELHGWYQIHGKSTGDLVFLSQPPATRDIRLVYCGPHSLLTADTSSLNSAVPLNYLKWRAAYYIYRQRLHEAGKDASRWTGLMNEAAEYAARALAGDPIRLPYYTPKMNTYDDPSVSLQRASIQTAEIPTS